MWVSVDETALIRRTDGNVVTGVRLRRRSATGAGQVAMRGRVATKGWSATRQPRVCAP